MPANQAVTPPMNRLPLLLGSRSRRVVLATFAAAVVALAASSACTMGTRDNFANPPAAPPSTCAAVATAPGCAGGAVSYSCTAARPDDGDDDLVCDDGAPGIAGEATTYCCVPYGQWATACRPSRGIAGCGSRSVGFSCLGETTPDQADPALVCSEAMGSGDARRFCCATVAPAPSACRCATFDADAGVCGGVADVACGGASIGFTCAGGHAPTELNPILDCSSPEGGVGGTYCCRTP